MAPTDQRARPSGRGGPPRPHVPTHHPFPAGPPLLPARGAPPIPTRGSPPIPPGPPGAMLPPSPPSLYEKRLSQEYVRALNRSGAINVNWSRWPHYTDNVKATANGFWHRIGAEKDSKDSDDEESQDTDEDESQMIHPCLRRDRFLGGMIINDKVWEVLLPSLRLVTCLLDDLRVIAFFNGLIQRQEKHQVEAPMDKTELGDVIFKFKDVQPITDKEIEEVYQKMIETRDKLSWRFGALFPVRPGTWIHGSTQSLISDDGHHHRAEIIINHAYLKVLRGQVKASEVLQQEELGEVLDEQAATIRLQYLLAKVMFHEFAHAFSWIHFRKPQDVIPPQVCTVAEPFYHDFRASEMGCTLEQFVFGSMISTMRGHQKKTQVDCAYGLQMRQFPGGITRKHKTLSGVLKHPDPLRKWPGYAIHMDSIIKFFTPDFWLHAERYGGADAFRVRDALIFRVGDDVLGSHPSYLDGDQLTKDRYVEIWECDERDRRDSPKRPMPWARI